MARMKDIITKLPDNVMDRIEEYRFQYGVYTNVRLQAEVRGRMAGYVLGLRDAGLITEFERRALFCYMTVAPLGKEN